MVKYWILQLKTVLKQDKLIPEPKELVIDSKVQSLGEKVKHIIELEENTEGKSGFKNPRNVAISTKRQEEYKKDSRD